MSILPALQAFLHLREFGSWRLGSFFISFSFSLHLMLWHGISFRCFLDPEYGWAMHIVRTIEIIAQMACPISSYGKLKHGA